MSEPTPAFRRSAAILTLAGVLPFIGLVAAMASLDPPTNSTAGLWLQTYTAVILSFLGGIRWGLALARPGHALPLALSVLPALAAWAMLPFAIILQTGPHWYLAYALLFGTQLAWDWGSADMPAWFKPLRLAASAIVIASLVAAWAVMKWLF